MQTFAAMSSTWKLDDKHILTGTKEFTCVPRLQAANKARWCGKRDQEVETICGPNINLRPNLCIDLSTCTLCRMLLIQNIIRVIFKYVYEAGSLITYKMYPPLTILIMSQKLWFYIFILYEDGNDEDITDETHSVDDYDEDENENEEYDDYQSSSWRSMYSYSSPCSWSDMDVDWVSTYELRLLSYCVFIKCFLQNCIFSLITSISSL